MDDQMIDLMAGDETLRRRLDAYAELRLSPDLTTSSRLRARVLAVAHRHASLARADAALTLLSRPDGIAGAVHATGRGRRRHWQRAGGVVLAASLTVGMVAGGASAARPGGPLYDTRLWAETLTLPSEPSARALAELDRLQERLREIDQAGRSGDAAGATAALAAYEAIVDQASASAILAGDEVAAAVLQTGVGRNVAVLQALAARVPPNARAAIGGAVDAAIARSADAIQRIGASRPGGGRDDGAGNDPAATDPTSTPRATKTPTAQPTAAPAGTATPKPRATHKVSPEPTATAEPTAAAEPTATPTATPESTATPDETPKPKENQGGPTPPGSAGSASGSDPEEDGD